MEENIKNIDADVNKIDLKECFEVIGMQTFFRIRAENEIIKLRKANEELQRLVKTRAEPKQ